MGGRPTTVPFPSAKEYFEPFIADPTELSYGGRYVLLVGGDRLGEIMIGDTAGIVRWDWGGRGVQVNLAGGAIARFNLSTAQNSLDVLDLTGAVPIDIRLGPGHTIRTGAWHTSSHLGDDFIDRQMPVHNRTSMDSFKAYYAYVPGPSVRLYAGTGYAVNKQNMKGRNMLQFGSEWYGPRVLSDKAQVFAAQDLQSYKRSHWNPSYNLRGGLRFADSKRIAAAKVFIEYFSGRQYFLQFYDSKETRWTFGINFEIGNPVRSMGAEAL